MTSHADLGPSPLDPLPSVPDEDDQHDEVMPEGRWQFDAEVAGVFDDMLARSIPDYDTMRAVVAQLAAAHLPDHGVVLDVGCSRGGALRSVLDLVPGATGVGLEVSAPMLDAARARFADDDGVRIERHDLRTDPMAYTADVTLCVLTLQFTPIEHRQRILADLRRATRGALILVEKVLGADADIDATMTELYYDHKREVGYTDEQIERKRLSLEGALVPVTAAWNEELLRGAGFSRVDCVWRWLPFAAWLALP